MNRMMVAVALATLVAEIAQARQAAQQAQTAEAFRAATQNNSMTCTTDPNYGGQIRTVCQ